MCTLLIFSCKKDKSEQPIIEGDAQTSFYVLSEGLWNTNDARLDYVNNNDLTVSYFKLLSGRRLGDVGNDILRYGNKLYLLINNSIELWCLVASGGLNIWVSSISFQKK